MFLPMGGLPGFGLPGQQMPGQPSMGGGFLGGLGGGTWRNPNPGLLGLAQGLLAASGPSPYKVGLGQALGQGLQGMQQAQQQARQEAMQNRQLDMQEAQHKAQMERFALEKAKYDRELELQKQRAQIIAPTQPGLLGITPSDASGRLLDMPVPDKGLVGGEFGVKGALMRMAATDPDALKTLAAMENQQQGRGDYFSPVQTSQGVMTFNHRTGQIVAPSTRVLGSSSDPNLQGQIFKEKEKGRIAGEIEGTTQFKRPQQARSALELLRGADELVDKATGSIGGNVRDVVRGGLGDATEGAKAIAQLRILQAGLIQAMPRMEGPQSDRDVQLYKEAAGQLGDPYVPGEIKKAALKTIREINHRYMHLNQGSSTQSGPGAQGATPSFDELWGPR